MKPFVGEVPVTPIGSPTPLWQAERAADRLRRESPVPDVRRREFITLLCGAVAWPMAVRAAGKQPRVAVLTLVSAADEIGRIAAFMAGMRELGYVAGQTFVIDYRYADGEPARLGPLAHELIALAPGVVFAGEPSAARAVKAIAANLPIVCPILSDRLPDLFESYARPGGSVTG